MSKFIEIKKAVSELVADSDAYWNQLYLAYGAFHSKYRDYLGLTNDYVISNNEKIAILQTGVYDEEEKNVVPHAPFALKKDGKKLCFDLVLNLCTTDSPDVVMKFLVKVKFSKQSADFIFEIGDLDEKIVCKETNGQVDFLPLFDGLQELLINNLKFNKE
ncbi:hypothetical protein BK796_20555 [Kosakonia pseudosacchari]|uniref:Uncharacterized protein n=1 Tax=Kosakonia pseudosacchari TaxID=1646340 RepID=A0ABX4IJI5_9ENTR|nr:hypothetical protein [Kosakonia pseudosacchari]PDO83368.1 hypothetical protein BK796_20555 [Kosakonia pseudosacchari]